MSVSRRLFSAYVAGLSEERRAVARDDSVFATALADAVETATGRFPQIKLPPEAFAGWLAEHVGDRAPFELPQHVPDLYLAWACLAGDEAALDDFERTVLGKAQRALVRLGLSGADLDDVKQDLRVRLLLPSGDNPPRLATYEGTGPLVAWTGAAAVRRAIDLRRSSRSHESIDAVVDLIDTDPQLDWLQEQQRLGLKAAFQAAILDLPPRDRAVLRALVIDGKKIGEVAEAFHIHRVTASRWVTNLRHALLAETRVRLRDALDLDDRDVDSMLQLVDNQLEVSFSRVLAESS